MLPDAPTPLPRARSPPPDPPLSLPSPHCRAGRGARSPVVSSSTVLPRARTGAPCPSRVLQTAPAPAFPGASTALHHHSPASPRASAAPPPCARGFSPVPSTPYAYALNSLVPTSRKQPPRPSPFCLPSNSFPLLPRPAGARRRRRRRPRTLHARTAGERTTAPLHLGPPKLLTMHQPQTHSTHLPCPFVRTALPPPPAHPRPPPPRLCTNTMARLRCAAGRHLCLHGPQAAAQRCTAHAPKRTPCTMPHAPPPPPPRARYTAASTPQRTVFPLACAPSLCSLAALAIHPFFAKLPISSPAPRLLHKNLGVSRRAFDGRQQAEACVCAVPLRHRTTFSCGKRRGLLLGGGWAPPAAASAPSTLATQQSFHVK